MTASPAAHVGPACRGCKEPADTRGPGLGIFCGECWQAIQPISRRDDVTRASKNLGRRPTNRTARHTFDTAVFQATRLARAGRGL